MAEMEGMRGNHQMPRMQPPNLGQTEAESAQYNDYGGNAASKAIVNTSDLRAISQYPSMYMSAQDAERQTNKEMHQREGRGTYAVLAHSNPYQKSGLSPFPGREWLENMIQLSALAHSCATIGKLMQTVITETIFMDDRQAHDIAFAMVDKYHRHPLLLQEYLTLICYRRSITEIGVKYVQDHEHNQSHSPSPLRMASVFSEYSDDESMYAKSSSSSSSGKSSVPRWPHAHTGFHSPQGPPYNVRDCSHDDLQLAAPNDNWECGHITPLRDRPLGMPVSEAELAADLLTPTSMPSDEQMDAHTSVTLPAASEMYAKMHVSMGDDRYSLLLQELEMSRAALNASLAEFFFDLRVFIKE